MTYQLDIDILLKKKNSGNFLLAKQNQFRSSPITIYQNKYFQNLKLI